jgi:membrane-bound serine protease (ClpP class)
VLDTPGGLVDSTRRLTRRILASTTPIVVYVAPSGGRAASAGMFVTLASHVAVMAPGTTIGAAHPVQVGGLPIGPPEPGSPAGEAPETNERDGESPPAPATPVPSKMEQKIVNDTVSWARALAEQRNRNADWAVDAVENSVSITASEALELGVIELVCEDLNNLMDQLQGRSVATAAGTVVLDTSTARVEPVSMWWGEQLLALIAHPNIAFLLMIFGFYGILFELYSPGWGLSGTLGVVCIVLALFGLAVLPVNYLGLALIAIAVGLLVAEVFVTSYGALAVAGALCLVVGGVMLVDSPRGFTRVSLSVVLPVAAATVAVTLLLVSGIVRSHRAAVRTGGEGLIGATGRVVSDFTAHHGMFAGTVAIHGERWRALSEQPLKNDALCQVTHRTGLTLEVKPASGET